MSDKNELRSMVEFPHLLRGAGNAVFSCLEMTDSDKCVLIADEKSIAVASTMLRVMEKANINVGAYILERHVKRPCKALPEKIKTALSDATASIYTAHTMPGEYHHRKELLSMVQPLNLKHAHMINISDDSMVQGMLSDYNRIAKLNTVMIELLSKAETIEVKNKTGTDIKVELDPEEPWDNSAGVIAPGTWANLPNGELTICPLSVNGTFVCDGIAPVEKKIDPFELAVEPLVFKIKDSYLVSVSGGPDNLGQKVRDLIKSGKNNNRIGQFAVGTNFELLMPIGDVVQDLFVPGAYFSLGRSIGNLKTKFKWTAEIQQVFTARRTSLVIDGESLISNGRYSPEVMQKTKF